MIVLFHLAFVIIQVGGGTAGSVLARRLSDETRLRILLIEAGGMENIMHEIPLAWPTLRRSEFDWNFLTQAQEVACFGLTEKVYKLTELRCILRHNIHNSHQSHIDDDNFHREFLYPEVKCSVAVVP